MRAGDYSGQELPFIMGMEVAGTIEQVGSEVVDWQVGDRVFGRARGAHAEVVDCDPNHLMPLPANLSIEQGAAIPVGWAWWQRLLTPLALLVTLLPLCLCCAQQGRRQHAEQQKPPAARHDALVLLESRSWILVSIRQRGPSGPGERRAYSGELSVR